MEAREIETTKEHIDKLGSIDPNENQKRVAQRNIKHAFWDFESEGGVNVNDFLESDHFKKMEKNHVDFFKTENGLTEAVDFLHSKYSTPLNSLNEEIPSESKISTPDVSENSLRLETDEEVDARLKALDDKYRVITKIDNSDDISFIQHPANDSAFGYKKELPVEKNTHEEAANDAVFKVEEIKPLNDVVVTSPTNQNQEVVVKQDVSANEQVQADKEAPIESESIPRDIVQDKAPFLRDSIDLINERSERINNEVTPNQDINTVQEILQPQATESVPDETVRETKTEEVVADQIGEEQVANPENVEPTNTLDQAEEVEDILVPQTDQSINNTEQKEGGIESMEAEAVYVESIKNFTNSYKGFFENLLRYNESTLQKNGEESTDSILYGGDIDAITKDLNDVMGKINNTDTAKTALEHMVNINSFLMENLFPVKSGMSSASVEGYDFLGKSIDEIGASLVSFYSTLKASKQEGSIQEVATQLSESLGKLKDLQERKLGHLNDYLSR